MASPTGHFDNPLLPISVVFAGSIALWLPNGPLPRALEPIILASPIVCLVVLSLFARKLWRTGGTTRVVGLILGLAAVTSSTLAVGRFVTFLSNLAGIPG